VANTITGISSLTSKRLQLYIPFVPFSRSSGTAGQLPQPIINFSASPFTGVFLFNLVRELRHRRERNCAAQLYRRLGRLHAIRAPGDRITLDVGREICQRNGAKALLSGTISSLGGHYLIDLKAVACGTGDTLSEVEGEAVSKEDVLKTLSRASSNLHSTLGESLASLQKFDVPIEATTSLLEALKTYSMGATIRRPLEESVSSSGRLSR